MLTSDPLDLAAARGSGGTSQLCRRAERSSETGSLRRLSRRAEIFNPRVESQSPPAKPGKGGHAPSALPSMAGVRLCSREPACWTMSGGGAISQVLLGPRDRGSSVDVREGDAVVVELPENPTTGYRWAVHHIDPDVLALEASDFRSPPGAAMGAPGQRSLLFRVTGHGRADVELKLWRDWEGDDSAIDRYPFTVAAGS